MTQDKKQICEACGAIFIGDNFHSIKYVNVSVGPPVPIERFKLQTCNKNGNLLCLTRLLVNRTVFTKRPSYNAGLLNSSQYDDIATSLLKEQGVTMPDRYITIQWIEGARKVPVSVDAVYSPTTYIKGVDVMLSVSIEFNDSTNDGYLIFLKPSLVEGINLDGMEFDLYEGPTIVARCNFK